MRLFLLLFCLFPLVLFAQLQFPPASAPACLQTQVGLTNFTLNYHRPGVKGRIIFGELIPYGKVWRTGANAATLLRFDQPIRIMEEEVPAGTYAIYMIPDEEEWTFILNSDTTLWGTQGYDSTRDVLRKSIQPEALGERIESMEFRWRNLSHTGADLVLEWEFVRLSIPIDLNTHELVDADITKQLTNDAEASDYYKAARYYLDNDLDLNQAKSWMDRWAELDGEQFGIMRYQALIEKKLGNDVEATHIMNRSLQLAKARPNPHYVRMNTRTLEGWERQELDMTGAEVLERSIAYHDPGNKWMTDTHELRLYESRPGGSYRITDLSMAEGQGVFVMNQRRGRALIHRAIDPMGCKLMLNGNARFTEAEAKQYRLTCEGSTIYQNYYNYLWGLPMKLKDEGTLVAESTALVDFFGQQLIEVKITYTEEVGKDIWYFYFHPETYALSGYRFYHDEAANDGEYILLEEEVKVGSMRIPAKRHWYTHKEALYLGSDEVIE
ncbi:MAG: DUF6503 family protein [Bacteroidota bacterium]